MLYTCSILLQFAEAYAPLSHRLRPRMDKDPLSRAVYLLYPSSIRCGIRPSVTPLTTTHAPLTIATTSVRATRALLAGKTPACGTVKPGEPQLCARVGAGNAHGAVDPDGTGEPFNYHIINRYFDEYLLRAVTLANVRKRVGK